MEFRVLGPLEVLAGDGPLPLGGERQRAVLAVLLLSANRVVGRERLIHDLWDDEPPETAVATLQAYVSRLRKLLPDGVLLTRPPGYLLAVEPDALDLLRFESLVAKARSSDPGDAAQLLREALGLWRGPALAEFASEPFAQNEGPRLDDLRLKTLEERIELDLALGRHTDVIAELEAAIAEHPYRERLRGQLILALYRSGRQAEALDAFRSARDALDELGLEPGVELRELEKAVLQHDPALRAPPLLEGTTSLPPPVSVMTHAPVIVRKTVTVLFCDIVDDSEADPEILQGVLRRCLELATTAVERHGGTIEQLVGGGLMALFGVPVVHEDDALRAVHAAVEIRETLPDLGVRARIGIDSGEIITGGNAPMTGSVVAAGRRLGAAAAAGEVLIAETTARLVADLADLESIALHHAGGRLTAYRVLAVQSAPEREHRMPFVGRQRELTLIVEAWERARTEQRCELVTLVGDGGIGKTRLAAELLSTVDAKVVRGRCLPYGEAITYWPIVEILNQLEVPTSDDAEGAAVWSLLDQTESVVTADEIARSFRKTLEHAAAGGPLVAVFDDIQWAEDTLLDLIEHVALLSSGAAILLICMARTELTERRASWPVTLRLEPLSNEHVDELLPTHITGGLRRRITRAAGGNPLFIQEILAMTEAGQDEVTVPPTLQALLTARLDQLEPGERSVLGTGAVEGEVFHRGAVQALADGEPQITSRLASLVRKGLIQPDRTNLADEDAYRFRHLLIRDTAYNALPKATRADLHERFASWLQVHGIQLVSLDELLGHHLEQSYLYLTELGPLTDATRVLGRRAADRLAPAGRRALARGDLAACVNLLERALALGIADARERTRVQIDLGYALGETGRMSESDAMLAASIESATGQDEQGLALRALVQHYQQRLVSDLDLDVADVVPVLRGAVDSLAQLGDVSGLALAERVLAMALAFEGRSGEARHVLEQAFVHAQASGDEAVLRRVVGSLTFFMAGGPHGAWPVDEAIGRCHELLQSYRGDRVLEELIMLSLTALLAMAGRFDEARDYLRLTGMILDDLNQLTVSHVFRRTAAEAMELIGDRAGAEHERVARYRDLRSASDVVLDKTVMGAAAELANFYCDDGRWDEAAECLAPYKDVPAPTFFGTSSVTRLVVEARLAAHGGRLAEAVTLAQRAVDLVAPTENLDRKAQMQLALAEVLQRCDRLTEADAAIETAIDLYEQRGNVTTAARLRTGGHDLSGP